MRLDELKQAMGTIAEDLDSVDRQAYQRAVDDRVSARRRHRVVGAGLVAAVAVLAAVVVTPRLMPDTTPPIATDNSNEDGDKSRVGKSNKDVDTTSLPTLTDNGTVFYTQPAGATLIGHAVSDPGQLSLTFTVTPTTLDLAWSDFCWDPAIKNYGEGAGYRMLVNGQFFGGSDCGGLPYGPIEPMSSFDGSPTQNAAAWAKYGVRVGAPFEVTLKLNGTGKASYRRGVAPQLGVAIFTNAPEELINGVRVDMQQIHKGRLYRAVAWEFGEVVDGRRSAITLELPASDHKLYVESGADHVRGALVLDSGSPLSRHSFNPGVSSGGSSGDLVSPERGSISIFGWGRNDSPATGTIYMIAYELVE